MTTESAKWLRKVQLDMAYALNSYCNEHGKTLEQIADSSGVALATVKRMSRGTYDGSYPTMVRVYLAIGIVCHIELTETRVRAA